MHLVLIFPSFWILILVFQVNLEIKRRLNWAFWSFSRKHFCVYYPLSSLPSFCSISKNLINSLWKIFNSHCKLCVLCSLTPKYKLLNTKKPQCSHQRRRRTITKFSFIPKDSFFRNIVSTACVLLLSHSLLSQLLCFSIQHFSAPIERLNFQYLAIELFFNQVTVQRTMHNS